MSGGHFNYNQNRIYDIMVDLDYEIENFDETNFTKETLYRFNEARYYLELAYIYVKRIDYLLSGDDGEESFHQRLKEHLDDLASRSKICHTIKS